MNGNIVCLVSNKTNHGSLVNIEHKKKEKERKEEKRIKIVFSFSISVAFQTSLSEKVFENSKLNCRQTNFLKSRIFRFLKRLSINPLTKIKTHHMVVCKNRLRLRRIRCYGSSLNNNKPVGNN